MTRWIYALAFAFNFMFGALLPLVPALDEHGAGWAFAAHYRSEAARRGALPGWLHQYNHHRPHSAIGNVPPITRLTNLPWGVQLGQKRAAAA